MIENSKEKLPLFKEYYIRWKNSVSEQRLEEFGKLKNDEERIEFINDIAPRDSLPSVRVSKSEKDEKEAKALKESGNKAFGKSEFDKALKLYTESILIAPQIEGTTDLALTLANRSAVLYHLQEYDLAANDIDAVLSLNYPEELRYKVLERRAKCMLALRKPEEALSDFKNAIRALDDSKLTTEKKLKMQTDIQIMLGVLTRSETKPEPERERSEVEVQEHKASLSGARNEIYEAACDKIRIEEDSSAGRYAVAGSDIDVGETLLVEKAYCSVLLAEYSRTNCQHCFKRTLAPYPCTTCKRVVFCNLKCKREAESSYHGYECGLLETLRESGVSVTVLMALRILTQKKLSYFLALKQKLESARKVERYKSSDYLTVYHLVRHDTLRGRDDFFERSAMALFLLRCLKEANYFGNESAKGLAGDLGMLGSNAKTFSEDSTSLGESEKFVGGLLLRHLQILQFNAHEISELEIKEDDRVDGSKSLFVGGGLYPTLALFNHSCDPGIVRYFEGTKVIARAIKPIEKGELVAENYGPIYSQMRKKERREKLESQYWFKCTCAPCRESWPTFDEIDRKIIRFRCDARKETKEKFSDCKNVLPVPVDTEDFMIKCFLCGQFTNLFKGLKILQETDSMHRRALKDSNDGKYQAALGIYLEILKMLHEVLAPPFRDYLLCQQSIRKCMLMHGNRFLKKRPERSE